MNREKQRRFRLASVVVAIILTTAMSVSVANASVIRVKFKRGAVSATVSGRFANRNSEREYVIAVRRGQKLQVTGSRLVTVFITDPRGDDASDADASCNGRKVVNPTIAGDYRIHVSQCQKVDNNGGAFSITFRVTG